MKKMKLSRVLPLIFLFSVLILSESAFCQPAGNETPDFYLTIRNISSPSANTLVFDLYLRNNRPGDTLELALIQAGILVNPDFAVGNVTASLVPGSSQLSVDQQPLTILFAKESNIIKLPSRTLRPLPKEAKAVRRGTIISSAEPGTRVCTVKLENTQPFPEKPAGLRFSFSRLPYSTSVSKYLKGVNTMVGCDESNCLVKP